MSGDLDGLAREVVALGDDITQVNADAEAQALCLGNFAVPPIDLMLDLARTPQRLDRAGELGDDCLFGAPEHATRMLQQQPIDDLHVRSESCSSAPLILACRPTLSGHFGGQD